MADFSDYIVIPSSDGLLDAKVTFKTDVNGRKSFSFAILRRIQIKDGQGHTHWFFKKHIAEMRKLLDHVEEELAGAEENARIK